MDAGDLLVRVSERTDIEECVSAQAQTQGSCLLKPYKLSCPIAHPRNQLDQPSIQPETLKPVLPYKGPFKGNEKRSGLRAALQSQRSRPIGASPAQTSLECLSSMSFGRYLTSIIWPSYTLEEGKSCHCELYKTSWHRGGVRVSNAFDGLAAAA